MFQRLLILLIVVPIVELLLLLMLSDKAGWQTTVGLIVVSGFIGATLLRQQGWRTMRRVETETAAGRVPTDALVDGLLLFLAGGLMLTPGILTDLVGLALVFPPTRSLIKQSFKSRFQQSVRNASGAHASPISETDDDSPEVIDAHFVE